MLGAVRILSWLVIMTFGFVWTVGQAGLETTNRNLCDLAAAISRQPITDCHFANWIVWVWGIGALVALLFLVVDGARRLRKRLSPNKADDPPGDLLEHVPDIRVADLPNVARLFEGKDGDKLIPLLEAEKLFAWARPMGRGEPAPTRIPGRVWRTHEIVNVPRGDNPNMRNQSFIRTKSRAETKYYDVFLNSHQLKRVWPGVNLIQPTRPIPITPDSIYSFLNGYPIVRETDQAIASHLGLRLGEDHFRADALSSAAQHFGIASLADLEKLLREHRQTVIELSRYFRPKGSAGEPANVLRGHSVHMLLEMLAARTGSIDRYMDYAKAIGASCGIGFAENVIDAYREICPAHL